LCIILNSRVDMESVPLPSEDNVVSAGQVGWDGNLIVVVVLAFMLFPNLEPLHFTDGLVTIIGEVDKAVSYVKCIELQGDALRLSGLKRQPVCLGHNWVVPAHNGHVIGVSSSWRVLLIRRLWRRKILASWFRIGHPSMSVYRAC